MGTTAEARRYSGTRQLMLDLERKRSSVFSMPRPQSIKRRDKALLWQLNKEMIQTAPCALRPGPLLEEEEVDSAEGSDADSKYHRRKRSANAKVGARRDSKPEVNSNDWKLQRTSSF